MNFIEELRYALYSDEPFIYNILFAYKEEHGIDDLYTAMLDMAIYHTNTEVHSNLLNKMKSKREAIRLYLISQQSNRDYILIPDEKDMDTFSKEFCLIQKQMKQRLPDKALTISKRIDDLRRRPYGRVSPFRFLLRKQSIERLSLGKFPGEYLKLYCNPFLSLDLSLDEIKEVGITHMGGFFSFFTGQTGRYTFVHPVVIKAIECIDDSILRDYI